MCHAGEYGCPDPYQIKGGKWGKEMPLGYLDLAEMHGRETPGPGVYDVSEAHKKLQRVNFLRVFLLSLRKRNLYILTVLNEKK